MSEGGSAYRRTYRLTDAVRAAIVASLALSCSGGDPISPPAGTPAP